MARRVFFSFHYDRDNWRVAKVRNSQVVQGYDKNPFYDKAEWEKIKKQGKAAIKTWIDGQLKGTSVTVVLIGNETASRPWVQYEIEKSIEDGKGLIGIDISKIKDREGETDETGANPLPNGYPYYRWNKDNGYENLGKWIEDAAP
ncbi:MAG TPA: TIR domain-containing protein [Solirubrobacterales bacterium]|nr:TIR domain-containing protein [Solirubrobacterales bacterium]